MSRRRYRFEDAPGFLQDVMDTIDKHGRAVQGVFSNEGESTFHYTVGNAEKNLPEVIVAGLPMEVGHYVCNRASREAEEGTVTLVPGSVLPGYLGGNSEFDLVVCAVTDKHEANVARSLYGDNVEVVQLVCPDTSGYYPWEPQYGFTDAMQKDWFVYPDLPLVRS